MLVRDVPEQCPVHILIYSYDDHLLLHLGHGEYRRSFHQDTDRLLLS